MKRMPSHLVTEWMAFFSLENEEREQRDMERDAQTTVQTMKAKRRR